MDYFTDPTYSSEHEIMSFRPHTKSYRLILGGTSLGMYQIITFCPWCGAKLPKSLGKEWCQLIKEEFGIEDIFKEEWDKLPQEFKTDEWWRKRGL